jgi:hypothetical protein
LTRRHAAELLIYCIENFRGITQSNVMAELNLMMLIRQQVFALENHP